MLLIVRTKMTFASGNVQGVKAGAVFRGKRVVAGVREELLYDVEVALFSCGEEGGFSQLIHLIKDGGPDTGNLGVELEAPHHDGVDLGEDLADGGRVAALRGEVELGVVMAAGDLLDIFFPRGVEAFAGVGEEEGFVGVGEEEGLAGGGEEEGGARGGGGGGLGERGGVMRVTMMIHDRPHQRPRWWGWWGVPTPFHNLLNTTTPQHCVVLVCFAP